MKIKEGDFEFADLEHKKSFLGQCLRWERSKKRQRYFR